MIHNDILQQALGMLDDPFGNELANEYSFLAELCEVVQALTILKSRSVIRYANVVVPGLSYVTGHDLLPVVDLRVAVPDFFILVNVGINAVAIDTASANTFLVFPRAWKTPGTITEYWLVGNNLLGVRNVPVYDTIVNIAYIPYITVGSVYEPLVIRDEYAYALQVLTLGFLQARLSRFDLAKLSLERWAAEVDDAAHRFVALRG